MLVAMAMQYALHVVKMNNQANLKALLVLSFNSKEINNIKLLIHISTLIN